MTVCAQNFHRGPLELATGGLAVSVFSGELGVSGVGCALSSSPFLRPENMVHQTISTSNTSAPSASSMSKVMNRFLEYVVGALIVGTLAACGSVPMSSPQPAPAMSPSLSGANADDDNAVLPATIFQAKSRWTPVRWRELPGFESDALFEAWNAWVKSCERPGPVFAPLCAEVRRLSIGDADLQRQWLRQRLQPYRVDASDSAVVDGLLTAYFEPLYEASRTLRPGFTVPLYQLPTTLTKGQPWFTRQEMDTLAPAQEALRGRAIVYLADPVDALVLQIQGSGRIRVNEVDGTQRLVRLAYAGTNEQPYKSVGRWLLDQGAVRDATWPGIKAWIAQNPQRLNELLWSNPRLSDLDAAFGPRGAQGVPLTPGRSIAVDPGSIPYGTPVWLVSPGPSISLQKLVLAQDTGSAIVGAVRADYFAGWGPEAGELAGRLKQPLRLWVLWPKAPG